MEMLETNLRLVMALKKWDPLRLGEDAYDPEVADSAAAVHYIEDEDKLARKIQAIYEFSFEEIIPLEKCLSIARELLLIKNDGSCSI
ncbi:DUF1871 family protein [Robertmurraya sp. Marseille-Q9965]